MKRAVLAFALAVTGCSVTGTAELAFPRADGIAAPNVASVPTVLSELFGFPEGVLTSRATLVRLDDHATCFDLLIRRPVRFRKDRKSLPLKVTIEVDGVAVAIFAGELLECSLDVPCLPPGSALQSFATETDERVRVEGQRVCYENLPRARRELVLSANPGLGTWRFRFHFTDGEE